MLALFAQAGGKAAGNAGADAAFAGMMTTILVVACAMIAVGIAIAVFYCLTLSKALQQVRPGNRDMEPGQVWLVLIPLFNLYWNFKIASDVPNSLRREFRERSMGERGDDYGANIGKWYAICSILNLVPILNYIAGPAALVLWIIFWVKIAGYSKQLREGGLEDDEDDRPRKRRSRDDDEDEDEDDRPRRRRSRDDDDDDE